MGVLRDYDGWNRSQALDQEAEAVLVYLDHVADMTGGVPNELAARIDAYGVVTSTIALDGGAVMHLQVGDGWDRALWTCPSGRTYVWTWRAHETPGDLDALFGGRGIERAMLLRRRSLGVQLIVDARMLAAAYGRLRLALGKRLGLRLDVHDRPAR